MLTIVPAMLILSSLVLVICRSLNYNPVPLLLTVAICANSGAIATFASGLPNIMIGTAAGIPYVAFPARVAAVRRDQSADRDRCPADFLSQRPAVEAIAASSGPPFANRSNRLTPGRWSRIARSCFAAALILLATVLGFVFAQPLGVGMDFIAMVGAHRGLGVCRQRGRGCDPQGELDGDPVLHGAVHHHRLREADRGVGLGRRNK